MRPPGRNTYWTAERLAELAVDVRILGRPGAARKHGLSVNALRMAFRDSGLEVPTGPSGESPAPVLVRPPDPDIPIEDLVSQRIQRFERKEAHEEARALVRVKVPESKPIGLLIFGDPHIDDDGCDLAALKEHAELVRDTPGLYAASVGDYQNHWVGRLAILHAQQSTTSRDGWRLLEWWIKILGRKLLWVTGGNHDAWAGDGSLLPWIAGQAGALCQEAEVRISLDFPKGPSVRVNCRHDFAGHSQWNAAHGPAKALQMGTRDHLAVAGHRHVSGYNVLRDPEAGIAMHAVRVASYKRFDRYARDRNFRDQHLSPCVVAVIDPRLPEDHPGLVTIWWDAHQGADYLQHLRAGKRAA